MERSDVGWTIGMVVAVTVTALLAVTFPVGAVAVLGVGLFAVSVQRMGFYVALAGLALPLAPILIIPAPGLVLPVADVLALVAILAFMLAKANRPEMPGSRSALHSVLRPVLPGVLMLAPYSLFAFANNSYNFNGANIPVILQRTEIVLLWLVFGAIVWRAGLIRTFLKWFVVSVTAVSLAWIATPGQAAVFGMQKNSCGGYISTGILIVLLSGMRNKYRLPLLAVLTAGLISTGSRGSILGLAAAAGFLILFKSQWKRVIAPLAIACGLGFLVLNFLPEDVQARLLSQSEAGQFNINIRELFARDALAQFEPYPWTGVGMGNYQQRTPGLLQVETYDPHNVYVLALTEGGYILFGAFLLLVGGTLLWMLSKPKTNLTIMAITAQASVLVHSYVDVYWVRGTPAPGWFLIGAAAAAAYQAQREPAADKVKFSPAYSRLRV